MAPNRNSTSVLVYGLVIFSTAFLLFQVQPMLGKIILPWFGGAAGVWLVCLLFFQAVLLLGYLYAHVLATKLSGKLQVRVHVAVLSEFILPWSALNVRRFTVTWVLMGSHASLTPERQQAGMPLIAEPSRITWTDDYSRLGY